MKFPRVKFAWGFFLFYIRGMEFKTFENALAYAPNKALEFVSSFYATLNSEGKAHFRAKFKQFFLDDGTLPCEDENPNMGK